MAEIKLSKEKRDVLVSKIKRYFDDELNQDIGQFDAEFLLDFFSRELGPYLYNQGLQDARAILEAKLHDIDDAIYEIEQPV
ncbi:MAG: DUF2164 domain-containing protein [Motiliproteus sp.]